MRPDHIRHSLGNTKLETICVPKYTHLASISNDNHQENAEHDNAEVTLRKWRRPNLARSLRSKFIIWEGGEETQNI